MIVKLIAGSKTFFAKTTLIWVSGLRIGSISRGKLLDLGAALDS